MDGEDLVRVRGYGGEDETVIVSVFDRGIVGPSCDGRYVQYWGERGDESGEECHCEGS
jgi:hypothetical protein